MSQRTNQGGSVVSFVVVGLILAAVVAGGVYMVNQRNSQETTQAPNDGSTQAPADDKEKSPETNQPGTASPEVDGQKQNGSQAPTTGYVTPPTTGVSGTTSEKGGLPTTGPADTLVQILALGILTGSIVAFIYSEIHKAQSRVL